MILADLSAEARDKRAQADVAELVYALALGASGETHGGSSPLIRTFLP
jgi:hypothetical protein